MIVKVHIEWPTGSETVEIEIEDGLTEEEIGQEASDAFFNRCNFGWEVVP